MKTYFRIKSALLMFCVLGSINTSIYSQSENFSCGPTVPSYEGFDKATYEKDRANEIALIKAGSSQRAADTVYVIPIVFHILHQNGSENISDAQIFDQMRILNEDYAKLNADTTQVSAAFQPLIGKARIEFRLAQLDPFGNCTNGIDRIYTQETNSGDDGSKMRNWSRSKYLNVWVVKTITSGAAGYAYYPSATAQGFGAFIDGIMILNNYVGSIGTGSPFRARALTHEIGHYLSLPHVWGDTNEPTVACGDDGFDDTPVTKGWDSCPSSGLDECTPGIEENIHNYMEYSYCSHMFTKDQVAGMRTVLNLPTALRDNLWSETNLAETGIDQGATVCAPMADFYAAKDRICKGQSVTLMDNSSNGDVDTYIWSIPGGTPNTSTSANPSITFANAGWQSATLTVTNATGSTTKTIDNVVYVAETYDRYEGLATENFEGFNSGNINNSYGSVFSGFENTELPSVLFQGGSVTVAEWGLATDAGYSGSNSMHLNANGSNDLMVDYFVTPSFDLTYVSSPVLTFKYSAASGTSTIEDITEELKVYVSTNCGQSWLYRGAVDGLDLITAGLDGGTFKPTSNSQWASKSITLPTNLSSNVLFKFEYTSGVSSNDIYIDDIAIEGTLDVSNNAIANNVVTFPNPSSNLSDIVLSMSSETTEEVTIQLYNSMGQIVSTVDKLMLQKGANNIKLAEIGFEDVSTGIYFLKIQGLNKIIATERIVIQK